ncbi:MAG: hypothetical protein AABM66_02065 [Actinomycetota bacterium]
MVNRAMLGRLEAQLDRVENEFFALRENGHRGSGREAHLAEERAELIRRIVEVETKVNPEVREDLEADQEANRLAKLGWHQRRREETLRREWEQWKYRRSKLPPEQRGPMMKLGQRECRYCGAFFVPRTLRQRHCDDTCRKLAHKGRS